MELIERLKADGISKGLCVAWQRKLKADLTVEELAKLYIDGIDFCISEDYPTLEFIRENFKGKCEPYGVFVDDELPPLTNARALVLNGACKAMLEYDGYSVSSLYVRHDSECAVIVSDNAVLSIDLFDNAKLHLSVVGSDADVVVNVYGDKATIEYIGITPKSNVRVINNSKTTY